MTNKLAIRSIERETKVLLVILAIVGFCLLLVFTIGVGKPESLQISEDAGSIAMLINGQSLPENLAELRGRIGLVGVLRAFPLALIYSAGGINETTSLMLPLVMTLANGLLVFFITRLLYNEQAGLMAAFLWMVLPITVYTGTILVHSQTIAALFLAGLFFYLQISRGWSQNQLLPPALIGLVLVLIIYDGLAAACLLGLILFDTTKRLGNKRLLTAFIATVSVSLLLGVSLNVGQYLLRELYSAIRLIPEMEVLLPLIFIALTLGLQNAKAENQIPIGLSSVALIGLLIRYSESAATELALEPLFLLPVTGILMLLSGYFGQFARLTQIRKIVLASALVYFFFAFFSAMSQDLLIPSFEDVSWISTQSLVTNLKVLRGPVFLFSLVTPILLAKKNHSRNAIILACLLTLLGCSLVPFTLERTRTYQSDFQAARNASAFLNGLETNLPVYVINDTRLTNQLEFLSYSEANYAGDVHNIGLREIEEIDEGYLLYWENQISKPPPNWWQVEKFGSLATPRLLVTRLLGQREAELELENVSAELENEPNAMNYARLYGAAINSGQYCFAYSTWMNAQAQSQEPGAYIQILTSDIEECFDTSAEGSLMALLGNKTAYPEYVGVVIENKSPDSAQALLISKQYLFFEDSRVFDIHRTLKADTFYLYQLTVKTEAEVMPLYWKIGDLENRLTYTSFPEWVEVTVLFSTFGWSEAPLPVRISPVLFYHYGPPDIEIRDYRLIEASPMLNQP